MVEVSFTRRHLTGDLLLSECGGFYFQVRIEDDVLVTEDGAENLSSFVPRDVDDIEALMAEGR